jgi:putative membrane protein
MSSAGTKPAEAKPDSFALAMDRTWLAHERTLMAWVRTAASMISFGFTIYKFFQFEEGRDSPATHRLPTPRDFALIMVSIGLVSLLLATIGHRRDIRDLALGGGVKRYSQAELVAGIVSVFGLLVLVSTIVRG